MGARQVHAKKRGSRQRLHVEMGQYFRDKRERANVTLGQVADAAGYTPQFISNIERGAAFPSPPLLGTMLKVYRVREDEFLDILMKLKLRYYKEIYFGRG